MTDDELKQLFETLRQENAAQHAETQERLFETIRQNTAALREENAAQREENAAQHSETQERLRRHFGVVIEEVRGEVRAVAEGVRANTERIERLRSEMKEEFAEVRSMIKFSHAELDRRIRALEEGFADLQGRVERLETSTH